MTREEIKAKLEQAKTNKVLPEKMRALSIAKYEKMLADLPEDKPAKAEPKKVEKKEAKKPTSKGGKVKVKSVKIHWAEGDTSKYDNFPKTYKSFEEANKAILPVYKDFIESGSGGYNKVKFTVVFNDDEDYEGRLDVSESEDNPTKVHNVIGQHIKDFLDYQLSEKSRSSEESKKEIREWLDKYDLELEAKKSKKPAPNKTEDKKAESKEDYDCDKLIAEVKAKREKAKKSAEKSAKKPEVTKAKERIEKTYEAIETKVEKGEFTKTQLQKLIEETREYLKRLEKAIKSL